MTYEETRVDFCTALGGVANRSAARYDVESTTVGWSGRPVHTDRRPTDRCLLHRGNDRNVLQRADWPKHEWLWVAQRVNIEEWGRIKRRRWCRQSVDPTLLKPTAVQRTAQLSKARNKPAGPQHWVKVKNPKAPAVKRDAEEDWG